MLSLFRRTKVASLPLIVLVVAASAAAMTGCEAPTSAATKGEVVRAKSPASSDEGVELPKILLDVEKSELKLGFIKLTDCAPLVIAKEKGFFADEGLNVRLESQPNWKTLLDRVISGELDGAHMLSGQPLAASIGIGVEAKIVTSFTLDRNGNAITVSHAIWKAMQASDPALDSPQPPHPIRADSLRDVVAARKSSGDPLRFATVFPVSTHNYQLRYWLAAGGVHPGMYGPDDVAGETDADVLLSVTPPPQMPSTLEQGTIQGYCVGEPWNQQAVAKGIGVPVVTSYDIWKNNPEKVFGVTAQWNESHPNTHVAVVKALIRAGQWLDAKDDQGRLLNREEASRLLSRSEYVGADYEVIANSMTGTFSFQKSDRRSLPEFNVFFDGHATYPYYSDGIWYLTQMRRWGQIAEAKPESWYLETAREVYRPDVYLKAATLLEAEGLLAKSDVPDTDGFLPATSDFIDGVAYDGRRPLDYLRSHAIGNRD